MSDLTESLIMAAEAVIRDPENGHGGGPCAPCCGRGTVVAVLRVLAGMMPRSAYPSDFDWLADEIEGGAS